MYGVYDSGSNATTLLRGNLVAQTLSFLKRSVIRTLRFVHGSWDRRYPRRTAGTWTSVC